MVKLHFPPSWAYKGTRASLAEILYPTGGSSIAAFLKCCEIIRVASNAGIVCLRSGSFALSIVQLPTCTQEGWGRALH